jgi:hypothetical protein
MYVYVWDLLCLCCTCREALCLLCPQYASIPAKTPYNPYIARKPLIPLRNVYYNPPLSSLTKPCFSYISLPTRLAVVLVRMYSPCSGYCYAAETARVHARLAYAC